MERITHARDAVVEAVLAAFLVAIVEGVRVAWSGAAGTVGALAIAGAAAVTLIAVAVLARGGLAALARVPLVTAWLRDAGSVGAPRVGAAWSLALVTIAGGVFALVAFRVFAWAHTSYRFHAADAIGAVVVVIGLVVVIVLALGAVTLDRYVRPRLPAHGLDGTRGTIALGIALVALVLVPTLAVRRAVPEFDVAPVTTALLVVAALFVASATRIATRRSARWSTLAIGVATFAGTWSLGSLPRARLAIVEHGAPSKLTAKLVWAIADRDGDGFPGSTVGGADCDDADPARHPGAIDIAANGIDENCTGSDAPPQPTAPATAPVPATKPNIIVISVDALRADRLGAYGYARKTPVLDALAAGGARFTHAYTSCPSTRCAIPSLHTGRFRPAPDAPTFAGQLRALGYDTAAITCCERFAVAEQELAGFRTIDATADAVRMQRAGQSNADVVVNRAINWMRTSAGRPYVLWVHFYEPHSPYEAPAGPDLGSSDSDRYDREVAYVDEQVGILLAEDPSALVVITADHGEELGEHGIRFHARSLYNQVIRVPLIVRGAGIAPRVIDTPVSIVDIVPTLVELTGAQQPEHSNGRSLAGALRGEPPPARPILVELPHDHQIKRDMAAVIQPPYKVIWDREANAWSLYKLDDVADEHDLADHDPALAPMQRLLLETLDRETSASSASSSTTHSPR